MDGGSDAWFDRELAGCSFAEERLNKRLRKLLAQIGSAIGQSISAGLPRLGQHHGDLSFFIERPGQRSGHSGRSFSIDA
jgi:hypothetical protein